MSKLLRGPGEACLTKGYALFTPRRRRALHLRDKARRILDALPATDRETFYQALTNVWPDPAALLAAPLLPLSGHAPLSPPSIPGGLDLVSWIMARDQSGYLPDDILTKLDRASMSVGLETRVPLLDHRMVELAWRLPLWCKIRNAKEQGQGKRILRRVLSRHLPKELLERPKQGFGLPLGDWLRGPLRDWAESLLAPHKSGDGRPATRSCEKGLEGAPVRRSPALAPLGRAHVPGLARGVWDFIVKTISERLLGENSTFGVDSTV